MGTVLILKDGKREIVSNDRHFKDLVREYMGEDAAKFYEDRLDDIFAVVDDVKSVLAEQDVGKGILELLDEVRYD